MDLETRRRQLLKIPGVVAVVVKDGQLIAYVDGPVTLDPDVKVVRASAARRSFFREVERTNRGNHGVEL